MKIITVDLAAKASAVHIDVDGASMEFCSYEMAPLAFVHKLARASLGADLVVIEDVPYGISNQAMIKTVLRLQGAIIAELGNVNRLSQTVFVNPATWQREMRVFGQAKTGAARCAAELGYAPPDMVIVHESSLAALAGAERSKLRAKLRKIETDFVDAFLMNAWAKRHLFDIRTLSGVQPPML